MSQSRASEVGADAGSALSKAVAVQDDGVEQLSTGGQSLDEPRFD